MAWSIQRKRGLQDGNCLTFYFGWIGLQYKSQETETAKGLAEHKIRVRHRGSPHKLDTFTREESDVHERYLSLPRDCQSCWSVLAPLPLHLFLEDQVGMRQAETSSCVSSEFRWKTLLLMPAGVVWKTPGCSKGHTLCRTQNESELTVLVKKPKAAMMSICSTRYSVFHVSLECNELT